MLSNLGAPPHSEISAEEEAVVELTVSLGSRVWDLAFQIQRYSEFLGTLLNLVGGDLKQTRILESTCNQTFMHHLPAP